MIPPVELEEDAKEDEAAASRLIFFFFLALEGVAEAGRRPALPPARDEEGLGVWGVEGEANAADERALAAAADDGDDDHRGWTDAGRTVEAEGVRMAARAGWTMGVAEGVLRVDL
jgi:hypothetical protein